MPTLLSVQTKAQEGCTIFWSPTVELGKGTFNSSPPERIMLLPLALSLYTPYTCIF